MSTAVPHTDYRVEIWNGKEYTRTYVYSDGSREEHNDAIRALWNDPDHKEGDLLAYRIVQVNKQRPMKLGRVNWATSMRRRNDDGLTLRQQAELGATYYHSLRKSRDVVEVPVYPVKPSGRGTASEFRMQLAFLLTGATRTNKYWGWSQEKTRRDVEAQLAGHGFRFVEVDLDDY